MLMPALCRPRLCQRKGNRIVKTVVDYRKHAEECRALARQMKGAEQRDQLLKMAGTWDALATQRERSLQLRERDSKLQSMSPHRG